MRPDPGREHFPDGLPAAQKSVRLDRLTTLRVGGESNEFFAPRTREELRIVLAELARRDSRSPYILGGGANTLFPDGVYERPVISTAELSAIEIDGSTLCAEAGARLPAIIHAALGAGLGGLETFVGIPGTCGGGVTMNAGGGGWSLGERVEELLVLRLDGTGTFERIRGRDVPWAYRTLGLDGYVVVEARFALEAGSRERLRARATEFMRRKVASQPLSTNSAGCMFRNPPGESAGALIDRTGLKGRWWGGAQISERHANFIVNPGGTASAADVRQLVELVRREVRERFALEMETEVVLA